MTDVTFGMIVGFPRSGTTLLRLILDGHADISCPPEPWLTTACARFLSETEVDGPAIGVRTGLGFSGIDEEDIYDALRQLTFGMHARMASEAKIHVEKSGFDIFHTETLTEVFANHGFLIAVVRHPLDTIASNITLATRLGRYLPELDPFLANHNTPAEALAAAWADRMAALERAVERFGDAAILIKYEDLVADPSTTLAPVLSLLGASPMTDTQINEVLSAPPRIGLGDWKAQGQTDVINASSGTWKKVLSRSLISRIHPLIAPLAEQYGYDLPRAGKTPDRRAAMRQVELAARMARQSRPGQASDD